MAVYNRRQAALLLSLVAAAGLGIAIGHWRRTHPELADRLEQLDRSPEAIQTARADAVRADLTRRDDTPGDAPRGDATRYDIARSPDDGDDDVSRFESRASRAPAAAHSAAGAFDRGKIGRNGAAGAGGRRLSSRTPPATLLDLNHATVADLQRLPGIGPMLAARIVGARETGGPFASVDDLRRVSGIGEAKLERMRAMVTVSP